MNSVLKTYEEWLLDADKKVELGSQCLITYKLLQDAHKTWFKKLFAQGEAAFERALFDKGYLPQTVRFVREDDISMQTREIRSFIETYQSCSLEDFAPVVYKHARDFYNQVVVWENKSLWQYLKWWIKRKTE